MQTHYSWMTRLYLSASVVVTAVIALADPTSQHRQAIEGGNAFITGGGIASMVGLLLVALAGIADVVINDLLPSRFSITCTHRHRHVLFMLMAIGQASMMWMLVHGAGEVEWVLARYVVDALAGVAIATWGVRDHYFKRVTQ